MKICRCKLILCLTNNASKLAIPKFCFGKIKLQAWFQVVQKSLCQSPFQVVDINGPGDVPMVIDGDVHGDAVSDAANHNNNGPIERDICILGAPSPLYGLYVTYRLILRHILPAILVFVAMVHPETNFSKRVSYLFFGHLSAPCSCGEDGAALGMPHECPNMQTAMLKSAAADGKFLNLRLSLNSQLSQL